MRPLLEILTLLSTFLGNMLYIVHFQSRSAFSPTGHLFLAISGLYICTRAEAPLKVAEKGGEGRAAGEGRARGGGGGGGGKVGAGGWGLGLELWARARRANAAFILYVVFIYLRSRSRACRKYHGETSLPVIRKEKKLI